MEGTGWGGNPGVVRAEHVRETGEERAGDRIAKGPESGKIGNEFCNIAQYFAIEKAHKGGNH